MPVSVSIRIHYRHLFHCEDQTLKPMPPTQSWTLVLDIFHHYRVGKKHKMWHVPLSEKEGKFNGKSSPTVSSLWKMDSHFLAFLENRKRVGTASLEN